jgi:1,2-diacylglycerol 3-beta-glucosyltransferase
VGLNAGYWKNGIKMAPITIILFLLTLMVAVPTLYLFVITVAAWFASEKSTANTPAQSVSVLFIVPAHNEERGLRRTLESIQDCVAPRIKIQTAVIADNCRDDTAAVAELAGARVFVRSDPVSKGKGQALNWFINHQRQFVESVDYCAIVDADTIVDPLFASEAVRKLQNNDALVVQGFYGVANLEANWRTRLMAAALAVFHHLRPLGRCAIGGTAGLKGNGMMFHRSLLLAYGWPAFSNVEDVEFTVVMALDGVRVLYAPDACVYGDMPTTCGQAQTQRSRWEGGRFALVRNYAPKLLKSFLKHPRSLTKDMLLDILTPPLGVLVGLQAVLAGTAFLLGIPSLTWIGLAMLLVSLVYVFSGLWLHREPLSVWIALMCAPFYIAWKCLVYARLALFGGASAWKRTPRDGEVPG